MAIIFWDASGLVKRYFAETGSETVDRVFEVGRQHDMVTTPWGYLESAAILHRRLNDGVINTVEFNKSLSALQADISGAGIFSLISVSDSAIFACLPTVRTHNLNATDAALLTALVIHLSSIGSPDCLVVASDRRLLRAASSEGLRTLNPELIQPEDVEELVSGL